MRRKCWKTLKQKLSLSATKPVIIAILGKVIHDLFEPSLRCLLYQDSDLLVNQAVLEQQIIGWKHFFMGRISKTWSIIQNKYLQQSTSTQDEMSSHKKFIKWRGVFIHTTLQFSLDLWGERNNHFHGPTPKSQNYLRRQRAITRAKAKFDEGPHTVSSTQHRLFHNIDRRLEGRTRAIEFWIELVELAQGQRQAELEELAKQPDLFQFNFTQQTIRNQDTQNTHNNTAIKVRPTVRYGQKSQKRVQQNLRQLFLRTQPNVTKRT